jgi:hypothetical protein
LFVRQSKKKSFSTDAAHNRSLCKMPMLASFNQLNGVAQTTFTRLIFKSNNQLTTVYFEKKIKKKLKTETNQKSKRDDDFSNERESRKKAK